jgi:hypothetical protein
VDAPGTFTVRIVARVVIQSLEAPLIRRPVAVRVAWVVQKGDAVHPLDAEHAAIVIHDEIPSRLVASPEF